MTAQLRNWCFTSYNLTIWNANWQFPAEKMRYCVFQFEMCPKTGKVHAQGYLEVLSPMRMGGVKKLTGDNTMHLEGRKGTPEQARHYCMKPVFNCECQHCSGPGLRIRYVEGCSMTPNTYGYVEGASNIPMGPWEFGQFEKSQGARNDIEALKTDIKAGKNENELVEAHTAYALKNPGGFKMLIKNLAPIVKRKQKTKLYILCGSPATGKSTLAKTILGAPQCFTLQGIDGKLWFDGYVPNIHKRLIINEFYGQIKWSLFMQMIDEHDFTVEVKGGSLPFLFEEVVITSNTHYSGWYSSHIGEDPNLRGALYRRIDIAWWLSIENNAVKMVDITPPKVSTELIYLKVEDVDKAILTKNVTADTTAVTPISPTNGEILTSVKPTNIDVTADTTATKPIIKIPEKAVEEHAKIFKEWEEKHFVIDPKSTVKQGPEARVHIKDEPKVIDLMKEIGHLVDKVELPTLNPCRFGEPN